MGTGDACDAIFPLLSPVVSYSAILCTFLGLLQVFKGEAQDAQVLCSAVRPDKPTTKMSSSK